MADMLSVGTSGLLAFQNALTTTSHNISNAATAGYSRQQVELGTRPAEQVGDFYVGTGVNSQTVRRIYDQILTDQVRTTGSSAAQMETYATLAARLDSLVSTQDSSISPAMTQFFNDIQTLSENPSDISTRQVVLSDANQLTTRFNTLDAQMNGLETDVNQQIASNVNDINRLSSTIADLNGQIALAQNQANGAPPNDLLDARDEALRQLGEKVAIQTTPQDNGAINVFVGNGQSLVVGQNATPLTTVANPYDPTRLEVAYGSPTGPLLSNQLNGGSLGGALAFRREMLDPARNSLGQLAIAVTTSVNEQNRMGMDLNGQLGGDLFAVAEPVVLPYQGNVGNATLSATVSNSDTLTRSDYEARYDGSQWVITRLGDGVQTSGALPQTMDGLNIVSTGTPTAGDRFLIQPTAHAAGSMAVVMNDPQKIAAASPIRTSAALSNTGSGQMDPGSVIDPTNPALLTPVTIQFLTPSTYSINGSGSFAYSAGADITNNGWRVRIDGAPQTGDQFTVAPNSGGIGDNRNALALANLPAQQMLDNGSTTYGDSYGRLVGEVANRSQQVNFGRDTQRLLAQQATAARDSVAGVNLDEEAAQMMRFQQAYQAAAKVITTSNTLFQTLLDALRS